MSTPEPRSPLADAWRPGRHGAPGDAPLILAERRLAVAQIEARHGQVGELQAAASATLGLSLPGPGRHSSSDETTAIWIAPQTWLVVAPFTTEGAHVERLVGALGRHAAVVEQTHGKTVLRIAGAKARSVLDKGCRVDLHPRVFQPGSAAVTPIAHVTVVLAQVDDTPTFDLVVPANFVRALFEWLELSAAEFGYTLLSRDPATGEGADPDRHRPPG